MDYLLFDFSVMVYSIERQYQEITDKPSWKGSPQLNEQLARAMWTIALTRVPGYTVEGPYVGLVALDHKVRGVYWRQDWLDGVTREPGQASKIHYKGSRPKDKPPTWIYLKEQGLAVARKLGYTLLDGPGYEADDWAGACSRYFRDNPLAVQGAKLRLITCDTDWLQLVDDGVGIIWHNLFPHTPLVRTEQTALEWCARRLPKRKMDHPVEIAQYKADYGDSSDDLPPGSPIEVIDLWNPPSQYRPSVDGLEKLEPVDLDSLVVQVKGLPPVPLRRAALSFVAYHADPLKGKSFNTKPASGSKAKAKAKTTTRKAKTTTKAKAKAKTKAKP